MDKSKDGGDGEDIFERLAQGTAAPTETAIKPQRKGGKPILQERQKTGAGPEIKILKDLLANGPVPTTSSKNEAQRRVQQNQLKRG